MVLWRVYGFTSLHDKVSILQFEIEVCRNSGESFEISAEFWVVGGYMGLLRSFYGGCSFFNNRILLRIEKVPQNFHRILFDLSEFW